MSRERVASAILELIADDAQFKAGLGRAEGQAKSFQDRIGAVGKNMVKVGGAVAGFGVAAGASLLAVAQSAATFGDELQKSSIRTGVATDVLQGLKFASEQSGASFGSLTKGLKALSKNSNEANLGMKEYSDTFDRLGVDVSDASGNLKDADALLLELSDAFAGLDNDTEAAALAQEVFGKAGTDLLPLLKEGREGIEALSDQAHSLGIVYSKDLADASAEYLDAQNELTTSLSGFKNAIGLALIPTLTKLADAVQPILVGVSNWVAENPKLVTALGATVAVITGAGGLLVLVGGLAIAIGTVTAPILLTAAAIAGAVGLIFAIVKFRKEIVGGFKRAISFMLADVALVIGAVGTLAAAVGLDGLSGKLQNAKTAIQDFGKEAEVAATKSGEQSGGLAGAIGNLVGPLIEVKDESVDVSTALADDLVPALEDVAEEFDAVKTATQDWETAFVDAIEAAQTESERLNFAENIRSELADAFAATEVFAENSKVEIRDLTTDASGAYDDLWATIVEGNEKAQGDVAAFIKETNEEIAAEHAEFQEEMAEVRADHEQKMQEAAEKRYSDLFGSIKSKFGNIFESMIAGGQNPITALAEYFKNVFSDIFFEDILGAFVAKWLTPLAGKVQDILGGAVSRITGIGGGAITGLAGGGASAAGGIAGGAGSSAGGVAGGVGSAGAGLAGSFISGGLGALGGIIGGLINRGSGKDTAGATAEMVRWITDYWPEWSNFFGRWDTYIPQMDTWLFSIQGHIERMRFINEKYLPIIASNTAAINVSINQNITGNAEGFGSIREANRELVEGIKEAFRSNTAGIRTEILAARP